MRRKLRVVLDTSTVVSGVIGGISTEVLDLLKEGVFEALVSEEIFREYTEVLNRPKFGFPRWVINDILGFLRAEGIWVFPRRKFSVIKEDPDDNKFLEAALEGKADYILSGDKHLLNLEEFEGIPIIGSREF